MYKTITNLFRKIYGVRLKKEFVIEKCYFLFLKSYLILLIFRYFFEEEFCGKISFVNIMLRKILIIIRTLKFTTYYSTNIVVNVTNVLCITTPFWSCIIKIFLHHMLFNEIFHLFGLEAAFPRENINICKLAYFCTFCLRKIFCKVKFCDVMYFQNSKIRKCDR